MKRIDAYLAEEQVPEWACSLLRPDTRSPSGSSPRDDDGDDDDDMGPGFKDAVFQWDSGSGGGAGNKGGPSSAGSSPASSSSSSLNGDSTPCLEGDANERTPLLPKTSPSPSPTPSTTQSGLKHGKPHAKSHFVLGPLDIRFPKGVLTILAGPTGSGKSAILHALLGGE